VNVQADGDPVNIISNYTTITFKALSNRHYSEIIFHFNISMKRNIITLNSISKLDSAKSGIIFNIKIYLFVQVPMM